MAADDVARALMAMSDPGVREQVRAGDPAPLSGLSLTEEEADLLRRAAGDETDVTAFSMQQEASPTGQAIGYARGNIADPTLANQFGSWLAGIGNNWLQAGRRWLHEGS